MRAPFTTDQRTALSGLWFALTLLAVCALVLLFTGCATSSGSRWYAPATWFSGRAAEVADKAIGKRGLCAHLRLRDANSSQAADHEKALGAI